MRCRGFTLVELLLVLFLIALLASLVAPVITGSIGRARESTLKEDLHTLRKAIDDFYADNGRYPSDLDELVKKHYVRKVPKDPMTDRVDSWIFQKVDDAKNGGIIDVHSASEEKDSDGVAYKDW